MSGLCYNCSTCHLQAGPCQRELIQCEICYSWGHQYIFCPRGVGLRDGSYRYWALCHNCDRWHLLHPCDKPLHSCGQCGHTGHMEFFCPVRPIGRMAYIQQRYMLTANGPQPTNHGYRLSLDGAIPHETITHIKLDAVRQAFSLLDEGVQPVDVFAFMAGPPRIVNPSPMSAATGSTIEQHPNVGHPGFQQAPWAPLPLNLPVQPAAHQMTQPVKKEPEHGHASTYVSMHQRFDQGDLAQSIEQERPMDTMPMTGDPSVAGMRASREVMATVQVTTPAMQNLIMETQNTEYERQGANLALENNNLEQAITPTIEIIEDTGNLEKTEKPKKVAKTDREGTPGGSAVKQGRRCAACVKSHKKCKHRAQMSPKPQPAVDASFGTPSTATNFPAMCDASEGPTPTVLPDDFFVLPNEHAAMPTPTSAPKKASTVKLKH